MSNRARRGSSGWPLERIDPGGNLPAIGTVLSGAQDVPALYQDGFHLYLVQAPGLFQSLLAVSAACEFWNRGLVVVANSPELESHVRSAGQVSFDMHLIRMPEFLAAIGVAENTIVYIKDGKVVDAGSVLLTPSSVRSKFEFIAS